MASSSSNAASSSKESKTSEVNKDYDEELDIFSPKFNPEKALYSSELSIPYPNIKTFQSVSSYEDAVRRRQQRREKDQSNEKQDDRSTDPHRKSHSSDRARSHEKHKTSSKSSRPSSSFDAQRHQLCDQIQRSQTNERRLPEKLDSKSLGHRAVERDFAKPLKPRESLGVQSRHKPEDPHKPQDGGESSSAQGGRSRNKTPRNIFTRMEAMSGPLSMLSRCVKEKIQVRVMTRGAVTVRGICRGYIIAFDKYFNMAMIDVDEIYRRPAALGKVRSRRSHKLVAAQNTLHKERQECQVRWNQDKESQNKEVTSTSSSFQELTIMPDVSVTDLHSILATVSKSQSISEPSSSSEPSSVAQPIDIVTKLAQNSGGKGALQTQTEIDTASNIDISSEKGKKSSKSSEKIMRRINSVYEGLKAPLSPFEREALMLGIPDENIEHRHVNQMMIRGENVVMVSIIEDL